MCDNLAGGHVNHMFADVFGVITDTLQRVLGKQPEHTHIVIDEIDAENWGFAGMLTTDFRQGDRPSSSESA